MKWFAWVLIVGGFAVAGTAVMEGDWLAVCVGSLIALDNALGLLTGRRP